MHQTIEQQPKSDDQRFGVVFQMRAFLDIATYSSSQHQIGHDIGKYIVGLYMMESIIKSELDKHQATYTKKSRNFIKLWRMVPFRKRRAVEERYSEILYFKKEHTFNICSSIDRYFKWLRDDPFNSARFYKEQDQPLLFAVDINRFIIESMFAVFVDGYPMPNLSRRYNTRIVSYKAAIGHDKAKNQTKSRIDDGDPHQEWDILTTMRLMAATPFDDDKSARYKNCEIGYAVCQCIVFFHIIETSIKLALRASNIRYNESHNLEYLVGLLPVVKQLRSEEAYRIILENRVEWTWDVYERIDTLFRHLGDNPIADARYRNRSRPTLY